MTLEINFLKIRSNEQLIKNYHTGIRDQKCDAFFSRQFFALFFVFAQKVSSKKTHAREKKHTTYDAQKDIIIPLFAQ
jgi:hypothetical protein